MIYFVMLPIGYRIYSLRGERKITQNELAERTGIPQPSLSKIEGGKQDPTVSTLLRICSALRVTPAKFFKEESARPPVLTRALAEKIARAVVGEPAHLSIEEKKTAKFIRELIPKVHGRTLSTKRIYVAWQELKSKFSREEIKTLFERVQDAQARRRSK